MAAQPYAKCEVADCIHNKNGDCKQIDPGPCPEYEEEEDEEYFDEDDGYRDDFADPGGNSALRAETPDNPRIHPCPTCGAPNTLTPKDVALGYQCDRCADRAEAGVP